MPDRKPWRQQWRNANGLKRLAQALTVVGVIASGVWAVELRYAKAGDFQQHLEDHRAQSRATQAELLRTRLDATEQRIFELQSAQRVRALTSFEAARKVELERQRDDMRRQLDGFELSEAHRVPR